jgi:TRAP-type C4-dicarboxylate transport system permease small subunit
MRALEGSGVRPRPRRRLARLRRDAALPLLVCVSVGARYLFAAPMGWSDKVAGWLVVALVLLAAPEAQRRFEHIGVDVAVGRIGPRLARWAHLLGALSVALVAAILLPPGSRPSRSAA